MKDISISNKVLRALWADYDWYLRDPVGIPSLRLEQLCTRIDALIEEYKVACNLPKSANPYGDYQ